MKNTYNVASDLFNNGIVGIITNKKTKKSKRYLIFTFCILFYLVLIGLCFINGINAFRTNKFIFGLLTILGVILTIDFFRFFNEVENDMKKTK